MVARAVETEIPLPDSSGLVSLRFDESPVGGRFPARSHLPGAPALHPPRAGSDALAAGLAAWEERTRSEYRGMAAARHFHGVLVRLNAPLDLQELALVLALQEQRHARLCANAAAALGGTGELTLEAGTLRAPNPGDPLEARFWDFVVGSLMISEVVAFRLLASTLRLLPASGFRRILASILADEALHARLGYLILDAVRAGRGPRWIAPPPDASIRDYARLCLERCRGRDVVDPREEALFADPRAARALLRMGIPPSGRFKAIYFQALERDVPRRFKALGIIL